MKDLMKGPSWIAKMSLIMGSAQQTPMLWDIEKIRLVLTSDQVYWAC